MDEVKIVQITNAKTLLAMRQVVERLYVDPDLESYIASLVHATRSDRRIAVGASPRGSLALLKLARAQAALEGRDYVVPDDIKAYVRPALVHRLILEPEFWMKRQAVEDVLSQILDAVPVPVIQGI
jgi:MoxR-like ATPase